MKLLLLTILSLAPALLFADGITSATNPKMLLKSTNTWTAAQTFNGQVTLNGGCVGCYPDWVIDGTFTGVNIKGVNPLYFKSLQVDTTMYILNAYTVPE